MTAGISSSGVIGADLTRAYFWLAFALAVVAAPVAAGFAWKSLRYSLICFLATAVLMGAGLWRLDSWLILRKAEQDAANQPPPAIPTVAPPPSVPIIKTPPLPVPSAKSKPIAPQVIQNGDCDVNQSGNNNHASTNCTPQPKPPMFNFFGNNSSVTDSYFSGVGVNVGGNGMVWGHNVVDATPWFRHLEAMKALEASDAVKPRFVGKISKAYFVLLSSGLVDLFFYPEIENKGQPSTIDNWRADIKIADSNESVDGTPLTSDKIIRSPDGKQWASLPISDSTPEITSRAVLGQSKSARGWVWFAVTDKQVADQMRYGKHGEISVHCHDDIGTDYLIGATSGSAPPTMPPAQRVPRIRGFRNE